MLYTPSLLDALPIYSVHHFTVIGSGNSVSHATKTIVIGDNRNLDTVTGAVVIGNATTATPVKAANNSVTIGSDSLATFQSGVAIGNTASSSGSNAIAMGTNSKAATLNTVAIGNTATATSMGGVAIGNTSTASSANATAPRSVRIRSPKERARLRSATTPPQPRLAAWRLVQVLSLIPGTD